MQPSQYTYVSIHKYNQAPAQTCKYICTNRWTHACTPSLYTCTHYMLQIHTCIPCVPMHICVHLHVYTHTCMHDFHIVNSSSFYKCSAETLFIREVFISEVNDLTLEQVSFFFYAIPLTEMCWAICVLMLSSLLEWEFHLNRSNLHIFSSL